MIEALPAVVEEEQPAAAAPDWLVAALLALVEVPYLVLETLLLALVEVLHLLPGALQALAAA